MLNENCVPAFEIVVCIGAERYHSKLGCHQQAGDRSRDGGVSRYDQVAGDCRGSCYLSRSYDVQLGSWDGDAKADVAIINSHRFCIGRFEYHLT